MDGPIDWWWEMNLLDCVRPSWLLSNPVTLEVLLIIRLANALILIIDRCQ